MARLNLWECRHAYNLITKNKSSYSEDVSKRLKKLVFDITSFLITLGNLLETAPGDIGSILSTTDTCINLLREYPNLPSKYMGLKNLERWQQHILGRADKYAELDDQKLYEFK